MPCRRLEGERGRVAEHHDVADRRHEPDAPGRLRSDPGALPSSSCGQGSWRRVPRPPVHQRAHSRQVARSEPGFLRLRQRLHRRRQRPSAPASVEGLQAAACTSISTAAPSFALASSATSAAIGCKVQPARWRCASRTSGPVVAGLSSAGSTPKAPAMAFLAASSVSTAMLSRICGERWSGPRPETGAPPAMAWLRYSTTSAPPRRPRRLPRTSSKRLAAASVQRNNHAAERRILEDAVQRGFQLVQEPRREGSPRKGACPVQGATGSAASRIVQHLGRERRLRAPAARFGDAQAVGARLAVPGAEIPIRAWHQPVADEKDALAPERQRAGQQRHAAPVEQVGARPRPRGRRRLPRGSHRPAPSPSARRGRSGRRCRIRALRQARRQRRQRVLRPARGRRHTRLYMQDVVAIAQRQAARLGRGERPFGVVAGE